MCDEVRLVLSAQLDGEASGLPAGEQSAGELSADVQGTVAAHLAECAGCREWSAAAERLATMVGPVVVEVPDLTERIMAAVARDQAPATAPAALTRSVATRAGADRAAANRAGSERTGADRAGAEAHARRQILRLAVAAAALVQLALAIPALISAFVGPDGGVGLHTSREMASFDVAVAVGFLLAAARPGRARAFLPVAVVLAGLLAATSGIDIARGATAASHEIGHLVALAQAGLLWALTYSTRDGSAPDRAGGAGAAPAAGSGTVPA